MGNQSNKQDLRITKTHKYLFDALFSLMEEKPLSTISVTDICQKAMVHRTTFYHHFEDKHHLLRCALAVLQQKFLEGIPPVSSDTDPITFYSLALDHIIDHLFEKQNTYRSILHNNGYEGSIAQIFESYISAQLMHSFSLFQKNGLSHPGGIPYEVLSRFYTGGFLSLASWWLSSQQEISREQFKSYCRQLITPVQSTIPVPSK